MRHQFITRLATGVRQVRHDDIRKKSRALQSSALDAAGSYPVLFFLLTQTHKFIVSARPDGPDQ